MPKRRKSSNGRSRKRRRTPYKRRTVRARRRSRIRTLNPGRAGVPSKTLVNHVYCDTISLNPGAGVGAQHIFRANSIYDPDLTGVLTGHQPFLHDQLAAQYKKYKVVSSSISVRFKARSGTNYPTHVGISLTDSSTIVASLPLMMESGLFTWRGLHQDMQYGVRLARNYSHSRWSNRDGHEEHDTGETPNGFNPVHSVYFNITAFSDFVTENPGVIDCSVKIKYKVLWTHPVAIGTS